MRDLNANQSINLKHMILDDDNSKQKQKILAKHVKERFNYSRTK